MKNELEPRGTSWNLLEPTRVSWNQLELPKTINSTIKRWRQLVAVVAVSCSHASESFNSEILLVSSLSVNLRESCWTALLQSSFFLLFFAFFLKTNQYLSVISDLLQNNSVNLIFLAKLQTTNLQQLTALTSIFCHVIQSTTKD